MHLRRHTLADHRSHRSPRSPARCRRPRKSLRRGDLHRGTGSSSTRSPSPRSTRGPARSVSPSRPACRASGTESPGCGLASVPSRRRRTRARSTARCCSTHSRKARSRRERSSARWPPTRRPPRARSASSRSTARAPSTRARPTAPWAGNRAGRNYVTQGNLLVGPEVLQAVAASFEASEGAPRHLADRLIDAIAAGHAKGGDARKGRTQSAAVIVADARPGRSRRADGVTANINVCENPEPVAELRRIYNTISQTLGFRDARAVHRQRHLAAQGDPQRARSLPA